MISEKEKALDWLKRQYKDKDIEFSELGGNVALFLERVWGLHHLNNTSLSRVNWSNDTWVEVVVGKEMATVDNNTLTRLVVIAHQMMLRIDLKGVGPGYIKLQFHQRTKRERANGNFCDWCPDIIDHVEMIKKHHPAVDEMTISERVMSWRIPYQRKGEGGK